MKLPQLRSDVMCSNDNVRAAIDTVEISSSDRCQRYKFPPRSFPSDRPRLYTVHNLDTDRQTTACCKAGEGCDCECLDEPSYVICGCGGIS